MDTERIRSLLELPYVAEALGLALLFFVGWLGYLVARRGVVRGIRSLVARTKTDWDDRLVEADLFARLAWFVPALVVWYGAELVPDLHETLRLLIQRVSISVMVVVAALAVGAFLTGVNDVYASNPANRNRPIKGYLQVAKIGIAVVATILVLATLMDRSPLIFLSGIGAMTAILLLVFRDTILSLVASVQLTGNDMLHVGDWIEMPQFGADGDVIDIALHTVKVQNWDKTITTIPTHKLISDPFKNWRGMSLSGGRRIKRAIFLDLGTIRFLGPEEVERIGRFALLRDYIERKRQELDAWNADQGRNPEIAADIRRLTNVGTFRAYVASYLRAHPGIHGEMTLIVRQLDPTPQGLPLEIYCFANDTDWARYEGLQSDLMDHFLAIAPEFGLRAFQTPTGHDLERLTGGVARTPDRGDGELRVSAS